MKEIARIMGKINKARFEISLHCAGGDTGPSVLSKTARILGEKKYYRRAST